MAMIVVAIFTTLLALSAPDVSSCEEPVGSESLLAASSGQVLLIGEGHGTEQAPEFVESIVCLALSSGESVVLGLEQSAGEQAGLDAYLRSDGGEDARTALTVSSRFWNGQRRDGRSSEAMLDLIEAVRLRRADGLPVDIAAIDLDLYGDAADRQLAENDPHNARDRVMARNLETLRDQADRVIVLVGNRHARRRPMEHGDLVLESIGSLMVDGHSHSVLLETSGGESWGCRRVDGETECGVHSRTAAFFEGPPRVIDRAAFLETPLGPVFANAFDSFVFLGPRTASMPVIVLQQ